MIAQPPYFNAIRERAARRWDQLEGDPELAGPWHQLFKQVQSPRHILSELLQNADDAGATEASVRIEDHRFIFTHNGEDFSEEHFASLCRFGYSNKRALHTIGFRGIGFKSTFSLGDNVQLLTRTLSVSFDRKRFTEPTWINDASSSPAHTEIRVPIADSHRELELEKNLTEWQKSPVSLLFFKHIRCLRIADHEMHWGSLGPGPVPDTEWMALHDNPEDAFLLVRSAPEEFPAEALSEIRQERLLSEDQEADFPPCKVEIVLGAKGRLYVVLPTGVETSLPFACNAPFIQDPARVKIKDPETSPTNRWLLERVGSLAATVMLHWLGDRNASLIERSRAYGLFPDVDRNDNSLEGACAARVEATFDSCLEGQRFLITGDGELTCANESIVFPEELLEIWRPEQVLPLLKEDSRKTLCRHVSEADLEKLLRWGVVERINKQNLLDALQSQRFPRPDTWRRLLKLWRYVAPEVTGWMSVGFVRSKLRIVPVQGKDVLYSAGEVVRLGEKRLLQSESDWEFLSAHLLVMNQNWPSFITDQSKSEEEGEETQLSQEAAAARAVLKSLLLEEASDISKVIDQVAAGFFAQGSVPIPDCAQLAQIAAKLGATVGDSFRFVTEDRQLRSRQHVLLFDRDGTLEQLLPKNWCLEHLLHPEYSKEYSSCSFDEWSRWISTSRAGLVGFATLKQKPVEVWGRHLLDPELRRRGSSSTPTLHFKTSRFIIYDWDFDDILWRHWTAVAKDDDGIWARVLDQILAQPESYWSAAGSARAVHVATTGNTRSVTSDPLLPQWILKFRNLPCLPDSRGFLRKPAEMLRRTPETESLIDVEFFVHGRLDREATRPLLAMLGVGDTPTGPDRLLDCLRALAKSDKPPVNEVEKWYRRLDQMVDTCSTADLVNIRTAFRHEKIILTEGARWETLSSVYLTSDEEDVPGAAIIRSSVGDLALWRKIGVPDRPTADLAIQWLRDLPKSKALSEDDARRVRGLLSRHPVRIWDECGHWLNLSREWVPVNKLEYALTMQTLTKYSHLHEWMKQRTADFQRLPATISELPPFSGLPRLAGRIEERFHHNALFSAPPEKRPWLNRLGTELRRIHLDDEVEMLRIRMLAEELENTVWQTTPGLEVLPYLDGTPAGTARRVEVAWIDRVLFVEKLSKAKMARLIPEKLGESFGRPEFASALSYCFERPVDDVTEYLEENFNLVPRSSDPPAESDEREAEDQTSPVVGEGEWSTIDKTALDTDTSSTGDPESKNPLPPTDVGVLPFDITDADQRVPQNADVRTSKDRPTSKVANPSIIERFARMRGFRKESDERYVHADGSWIGKAQDDRFPWERRAANGHLIQLYWSKDHCLEHEPLQLDVDIWSLIEEFPDRYGFVLANPQGDPVELPGGRLRSMREEGELTLYPATYRLVVDLDRRQ